MRFVLSCIANFCYFIDFQETKNNEPDEGYVTIQINWRWDILIMGFQIQFFSTLYIEFPDFQLFTRTTAQNSRPVTKLKMWSLLERVVPPPCIFLRMEDNQNDVGYMLVDLDFNSNARMLGSVL